MVSLLAIQKNDWKKSDSWNLTLKILKGEEYLTAFRTKYGHFEYLVMPFGLKNAPGQFQAIAEPLYKLTKKDSAFDWTQDCQKSFDLLKLAFVTDCVLAQPDVSKQFYLECDASDYALGAVLSQKDKSEVLRPICIYSRKLTAAGRTGDTIALEQSRQWLSLLTIKI